MKKLIPLVIQVPQRVKLTRHLYLSNLGDINLWYDSKWVWYLPVLYLPYQDPHVPETVAQHRYTGRHKPRKPKPDNDTLVLCMFSW
jgi:hypothetical protein